MNRLNHLSLWLIVSLQVNLWWLKRTLRRALSDFLLI